MNHIALLLAGDERQRQIQSHVKLHSPPGSTNTRWDAADRQAAERAVDAGWKDGQP